MAIVYLDGGRITGLSTDAKPDRDTSDASQPALTVQAGSVFIETDTGNKYIHNGTAWIQEPFESINDALGCSGGRIQLDHVVEWFTGKSLNTDRWNAGETSGTTTRGMKDEIDGGFYIHGGGAVNRVQYLNFNNVEQYLPRGSVNISVAKDTGGAARGAFFTGFMDGTPQAVGSIATVTSSHAGHYKKNERYNKVSTADGSNESSTELTDSYRGVTYHVYKTECNSFWCEFWIDGVLMATKESNLPATNMQPTFSCYHDGGEKDMHILYMEAYNT